MSSLPTITERLKHDGAFVLPYGFIALLFLLNIVAIPLPVLSGTEIPLVLMAIYYWSMYRPTLIPAWLLFIMGILMDLISVLPLGLNAVIFVASGLGIARKRRFLMTQPFIVVWIGFCALCFGMLSLRWALISVLNWYLFPFTSILNSSLLGGLLFPFMCVMLRMTHKILPTG